MLLLRPLMREERGEREREREREREGHGKWVDKGSLPPNKAYRLTGPKALKHETGPSRPIMCLYFAELTLSNVVVTTVLT